LRTRSGVTVGGEGAPATEPSICARAALDRASLDALFADVYQQLRSLARRERRRRGNLDTLDTTSLVHEVYARFVAAERISVADRGHFIALSVRAMRQVLVNYAKLRRRRKRGGGERPRTLLEGDQVGAAPLDFLLDVDAALARLEERSERLGRIVECRFFGGLDVDETAAALGLSRRTVEREWTRAKVYLSALLASGAGN
jgi:RNA polymerase sigma factor (TIGR02999 family)